MNRSVPNFSKAIHHPIARVPQFDWDDLRFILAVFDGGSAVAAARKLGVNATTVQRRIAKFEQQHSIHLFVRRQSGLSPTTECEALVEASRDIDERVSGIRRDILGRDLRLEGRLSVTTTGVFMYGAMAGHLAQFKNIHPAIELEFTQTHARLNLSRQDADIAIRPTNNPPEHLVGQRVSGLSMAVYAVPELVKNISNGVDPTLDELQKLPWIGLGAALKGTNAYSFIKENIPVSQIQLTLDSFIGVSMVLVAGNGVGILPCILGDALTALERIGKPQEQFETSVWVLTHPEIRTAAKIRAFMDFITAAMRNDSAKLEGRL